MIQRMATFSIQRFSP